MDEIETRVVPMVKNTPEEGIVELRQIVAQVRIDNEDAYEVISITFNLHPFSHSHLTMCKGCRAILVQQKIAAGDHITYTHSAPLTKQVTLLCVI